MPERFLQWMCAGGTLVGILHEPDGESREIGVVVVVGGPQYRVGSHRQFVLMARKLAAVGYGVLRFDYRGMGDSEGEARGFERIGADIASAVDQLLAQAKGCQKVVIFGLCDAASAALMYAATDDRVCGLALANPWVRSERTQSKARFRHYYRKRFLQGDFWRRLLTGRINLRGSFGEFSQTLQTATQPRGRSDTESTSVTQFVQRMKTSAERFRGPVLLLMSGRDLTAREFDVLCSDDIGWARLVQGGWTRVDLHGADHTWSSAETLEAACSALKRWLAALPPSAVHPGLSSNGDVE